MLTRIWTIFFEDMQQHFLLLHVFGCGRELRGRWANCCLEDYFLCQADTHTHTHYKHWATKIYITCILYAGIHVSARQLPKQCIRDRFKRKSYDKKTIIWLDLGLLCADVLSKPINVSLVCEWDAVVDSLMITKKPLRRHSTFDESWLCTIYL